MVMRSFFVILFLLIAPQAHAIKLLQTKMLFSADVSAPTASVICQGKLWVYSRDKNIFTTLDPNSGRIIATVPITGMTKYEQLSSAACYRDNLLLSFVISKKDKTSALGLFDINEKINLNLVSKITSPSKGRITDSSCDDKRCFILVDGVLYSSTNLKSFTKIAVPPSSEVKHVNAKHEENMFENWQDTLMISNGLYSGVGITPEGNWVLLDPFRADVVTPVKNLVKKWGSWGVWEGRMLSPKSITYSALGYYVISDVGLKLVFVFNRNGIYLGAVGVNDKLLSIEYGIHLTSLDTKIFISDFASNKVIGVDANIGGLKLVGEKEDDFLRVNLFRRPEVLKSKVANRCLACHDGTVTDELDKYATSNHHHPVNMVLKNTADVFTDVGNQMSCATCHNPHHGALVKDAKHSKTVDTKFPHFLRKDFNGLCLSCHQDKLVPENNHPQKKDVTCANCHKVHHGFEKLTAKKGQDLCLSCHKTSRFSHRTLDDMTAIDRAKGVHFEQGDMSCFTCHTPHDTHGENKLLRKREPLNTLCASCHGVKAETLLLKFHSRMKGKK